jgi:hypothetical protein
MGNNFKMRHYPLPVGLWWLAGGFSAGQSAESWAMVELGLKAK